MYKRVAGIARHISEQNIWSVGKGTFALANTSFDNLDAMLTWLSGWIRVKQTEIVNMKLYIILQ